MTPETLRAIRLSLGLTQTQLGARLGVNLRQIQRWESGDIGIPRGFGVAVALLEELEAALTTINPNYTMALTQLHQNYGD